ncbi:MAG: 2-hydroxyglutaryl-CoA dehydratase [Ruminococcaceae bacterium]|nr:2-hydroxyglutaryl-CoA dehydratase [Oscillospiraceae bacterium]
MSQFTLGIDIGSTTAKLVLMESGKVVYQKYQRHLSQVRQTTLSMIKDMHKEIAVNSVKVTISGSAGMGVAQAADIDFIQEVYATSEVVSTLAPDTGVVIELGGEDAKVIFFNGGIDERMNGTCAGGTGAFIDQMSVLLDMSVNDMDAASLKATQIYPIASRCGVFAKTDIQPLLNQGASKEDISASIFQAVVNQTITGLIQGRKIEGKVMFLGGPLYYCQGLRKRFYETLSLTEETAVFPEYALYSVAMGAAMYAEKSAAVSLDELITKLENSSKNETAANDRLSPLFENETEYFEFIERHSKANVSHHSIDEYRGNAWLGIDCGSTTTKLVLIAEDNSILYSFYNSNKGNPVNVLLEQLKEIYNLCGDRVKICGSAVTGYGEELIKHAFHIDEGLVETIAHYTAAKYFQPDVDFILDIGGQDIKCFRIKNGAIDSIMLNEACSSGCGSFIETFAKAMGHSIADFAAYGLKAKAPVNLGSRCTVFMNSSVKQSQKEGASVEDISAGLSVSVVKNAIYKVIRATSPDELGRKIVVQGGTFYNDAVLRAFEKEIGADVIRPSIAGLMGAYGAALHAKKYNESSILKPRELADFVHTSQTTRCKGCANQCHLTINRFADGKRFISGNQCEKGLGAESSKELPNLHAWKRNYLESLKPCENAKRGKIGLPLALSTFEFAPLWYTMFTELGFSVHFSKLSNRATYEKGQFTIPSDTACYPAKIMHGHVLELLEDGITNIFYPGITYNIDEHAGDNHYNCPIVAYYSELLHGNIEELGSINYMYPYLDINNQKSMVKTLLPHLQKIDRSINKYQLTTAIRKAFVAYENYKTALRCEGEKAVRFAKENGNRIMILAGRPYHIDPEIGHGIDKLATSLGFVVVSEDSVAHLAPVQYVKVLDQWTFHARLYRSAKYAVEHDDVELVQLVSFGCGVDAITTDEVRSILEENGKYYTQIKIDEITNLGAVKIRLRSLLGALEEKK